MTNMDLDEIDPNTRAIAYMYDSWGRNYDADVERNGAYTADIVVAEALRNQFGIEAKKINLIDAGTGTGRVLQHLKGTFEEVSCIGLDISRNMMGEIQRKMLKIDLRPCDLDNDTWPVEDNSADAVSSAGVISAIKNPHHFFSEAARVTRQGGIFATSFLIKERKWKGLGLPLNVGFKNHCRTPEEIADIGSEKGFYLLGDIKEFIGYKGNTFEETHGLAVFRKDFC